MTQTQPPKPRVAIIGGGVAGVVCARHLQSTGLIPTIFEKSRGLGGRLATRRTDENLNFDHGAQYFTMRDPKFSAFLAQHGAENAVQKWSPTPQTQAHTQAKDQIYVGVPAMNSWLKRLADGLDTVVSAKVEAVTESPTGCLVNYETSDGPREDRFDYAVITAPPPQIPDIIGHNHPLASSLSGIQIAPCWTVMLSVDACEARFDAATLENSPLAWLARNTSKPERPSSPTTWVAQASAQWSADNLEMTREDVLAYLLPLICHEIGAQTDAIGYQTAHRWRYAKVTQAAQKTHICNAQSRITLAGDWCLGPRVECAFQSGLSAADHIIQSHNA